MSKNDSVTTINNPSIATVSVKDMISQLGSIYVNAIKLGREISELPTFMLWGQPGVGKSQGIRQLAKEIEKASGKRTFVTDVRLIRFNPIDLRGIPVANEDKTLAVWLKPKIFDMNTSSDVVNILFLDEISAAPPSVQAAAYQITLDRVVGEHALPKNCIVIAAGNRVTDKSVAYKMPKALANRMCHLEISVDFPSWEGWAKSVGLDGRVLEFLSRRRDLLSKFDPTTDDVAFPTPRSWEMVSNVLLNGGYASPKECFALISGLVGSGAATEFCGWCDHHEKIPSILDIAAGKCYYVPIGRDTLYSTVMLIRHYLQTNFKKGYELENCINYAKRLPPDYTMLLFTQLISSGEEIKKTLMKNASFSTWIRTHLNK